MQAHRSGLAPRRLLAWLPLAVACAGQPPPAPTPVVAPAATPPAAASPTHAPPEPNSLPTVSGQQTPRANICPGGEYGSPPVTQTKAELLRDGFVFVEGPVWSDQLQALLFSEMDFDADVSQGPPSTIHLLTPSRELHTFMSNSGSNGIAIDETSLVAATHDNQALSRIDLKTRQKTAFVTNFNGKKFNSPNDLAISSAGHIYFSDPDWQLGKRPNETGMTGVYWVKPDDSVSLVDGDLDKPNGISLSPDDRVLYVGSVDGNVWSYSIDAQGKPSNRKLFAKVEGPDGMAVDCAGNLYVTSHGAGRVEVFDKQAAKLASIEVAPRTTNAAFGGPDRKTLYITAGTAVFAVPTLVPGYPY